MLLATLLIVNLLRLAMWVPEWLLLSCSLLLLASLLSVIQALFSSFIESHLAKFLCFATSTSSSVQLLGVVFFLEFSIINFCLPAYHPLPSLLLFVPFNIFAANSFLHLPELRLLFLIFFLEIFLIHHLSSSHIFSRRYTRIWRIYKRQDGLHLVTPEVRKLITIFPPHL